jgi:adenine-specific DNA-methyltransferase
LIFSAVTDDGALLEEEATTRLFTLSGKVIKEDSHEATKNTKEENDLARPLRESVPLCETLDRFIQKRKEVIQRGISERNAHFFEAEADKLEGWADDLKLGLEREIKDLDRQIKEARRAAIGALTLEQKLAGQKQIKALEAQRSQKRRTLFDAQDEVDKQREGLIANIEGKLMQRTLTSNLFSIRWQLD